MCKCRKSHGAAISASYLALHHPRRLYFLDTLLPNEPWRYIETSTGRNHLRNPITEATLPPAYLEPRVLPEAKCKSIKELLPHIHTKEGLEFYASIKFESKSDEPAPLDLPEASEPKEDADFDEYLNAFGDIFPEEDFNAFCEAKFPNQDVPAVSSVAEQQSAAQRGRRIHAPRGRGRGRARGRAGGARGRGGRGSGRRGRGRGGGCGGARGRNRRGLASARRTRSGL